MQFIICNSKNQFAKENIYRGYSKHTVVHHLQIPIRDDVSDWQKWRTNQIWPNILHFRHSHLAIAADLIKSSQNGLIQVHWFASYPKRTNDLAISVWIPILAEDQNIKNSEMSSSKGIRIDMTQCENVGTN